MEGTDICCEIERRVSDGFVYSEAVTRYAVTASSLTTCATEANKASVVVLIVRFIVYWCWSASILAPVDLKLQKSSDRWRKEGCQATGWGQCFDTVGWVAGCSFDLWKPLPFILKGSFLEQVQEETKGNRLTPVHLDIAVKMMSMVVVDWCIYQRQSTHLILWICWCHSMHFARDIWQLLRMKGPALCQYFCWCLFPGCLTTSEAGHPGGLPRKNLVGL